MGPKYSLVQESSANKIALVLVKSLKRHFFLNLQSMQVTSELDTVVQPEKHSKRET